MDATIAAVLVNLASSTLYESVRSGYRKLTAVLPVQKAISVTAERFPQFDALRFALTSWCDSPAFGDMVERLRFSPLSDAADTTVCQSFLDNGNFYSDYAEADARGILHVFVLAYMEAVYEGEQGPAAHAMRDLVDNARTHAGLERIGHCLNAQTDQITALQQMLQPDPALADRVRDILSSPDFRSTIPQTVVSVDLKATEGNVSVRPHNNLPQPVTSFVGREKEIESVKTMLRRTRLLTFTGSGGCGKTRLALEVAAAVLEEYPGGVWLVELASLTNADLVPTTVAAVLSVPEKPGEQITKTLAEVLSAQHLLLVVDNCEHLVDAAARIVDTLLRSCPKIHFLVTSREALRIAGETTYRVPSLSVPNINRPQTPESVSQFEAVKLFLARASAINADIAITDSNALALASICNRLDGIPLAIELAAARARSLSVEQIEGRLHDRFRLLVGGSRTSLPRQQTLLATIQWSYDLLIRQEKSLLSGLSVFAGGWTLEAVEMVCSGIHVGGWLILDLLTSLVDQSLVVVKHEQGELRYHLLETIRQYSMERLDESEECEIVRVRHLAFYLSLAEEATERLQGPGQAAFLRRLDKEYNNLMASIDYSVQHPACIQETMRFVGALGKYWIVRGHVRVGQKILSTVLVQIEALPETFVKGQVVRIAGVFAKIQGDYERATDLFTKWLSIGEHLNDQGMVAGAYHNLGIVAIERGEKEKALADFERALSINLRIGNLDWAGDDLAALGELACRRGEYESANEYCNRNLLIRREQGNDLGIANSLELLGKVALNQNLFDLASQYYNESIRVKSVIGDKFGLPRIVYLFAELAHVQMQLIRAVRLYGAAETERHAIGVPLPAKDHAEYERSVCELKSLLGEAAFTVAWAEGRAMTMEQAIAYALDREAD